MAPYEGHKGPLGAIGALCPIRTCASYDELMNSKNHNGFQKALWIRKGLTRIHETCTPDFLYQIFDLFCKIEFYFAKSMYKFLS